MAAMMVLILGRGEGERPERVGCWEWEEKHEWPHWKKEEKRVWLSWDGRRYRSDDTRNYRINKDGGVGKGSASLGNGIGGEEGKEKGKERRGWRAWGLVRV